MLGGPAEGADAVLLVEGGGDRDDELAGPAGEDDGDGAVGGGDFGDDYVFPGGIGDVVEAGDAVARKDACFGGDGVFGDVADDGRAVRTDDFGVAVEEEAGQQGERQQDIHGRTGEGDDHALPAGFGEKAAGVGGAGAVGGVFVGGLLAGHLDISAEGDERDAEIGFATAEAEQAGPEAEGEGFDADVEVTGGPVMTQFVDEDHDAEQDQDPPNVLKEDHKRQLS